MNYHRRTAMQAVMLAFLFFLTTVPSYSQEETAPEATEERIEKLQKALDDLAKSMAEIQTAIDELRGRKTPTQDTPSEEPEDLTAVSVKPESEPPAGEPTADAPLQTELVQNTVAPGASKLFNPDISVIGNFIARAGDENPIEERDTLVLDEVEIAMEAFVDPYAKAKFFLAVTPEGAEMEEGFIEFLTLPSDLTAKVGKMKANFGKVNTKHPHNLPWVDKPLVIESFFGEEGLNDSGVSVSRIFPNRAGIYVEATGEIFRGEVEGVFEPQANNDLLYLGHVKAYRDLTDNSNLEIGGSWARGTLAEGAGHGTFTGLDMTYRWKPLERAIYRSFIGRAELITNDRDDMPERAIGIFASGDYQFARRWVTGARIDRADRPLEPWLTDRGASLSLTFRPSEFSQIRGQLRRTSYDDAFDATEFLLQFSFSIGAHGAHTF